MQQERQQGQERRQGQEKQGMQREFQKQFPEIGEVVVCRVSKILNYGVFVKLLEFEGLSGFVHISQLSSGWVKNIRNVVKENQVRAAQVVRIDRKSGQIDLSFTKVSSGTQRAKIEGWNQQKRAQKLLEVFAKQNNFSFESAWKEVAEPLIEEFGSVQEAFNAIAVEGEKPLEKVDKKWRKPLLELVEKSVEVPKRTVRGKISIESGRPDGVVAIRDALVNGKKSAKDAQVEIIYAGSGRWTIKVTSHDYKVAEKVMQSVAGKVSEHIQGAGGKAVLEKLN